MSAAQLHLALNHFPVVGIILATVLLAAAHLRKSVELTRATLVMLVLLSVVTIPVYMSGEPAEEIVEHLAGTSEPAIHEHEEAAEKALLGAVLLGVFAFILLMRRNTSPRVTAALLTVAVIVCGLMAWTAHRGGMIRHAELRGEIGAIRDSGETD